jgi:WD40 repeat protein
MINLKASYEVAFSPDGQLLIAIGRDVVLWDFPRGEKRSRVHPLSHPSHVAFSRSGDRLAVKNTAGWIVILEPATGQVAVDFGNKRDGEGCGPVFSPCDRYLVDGTWGGGLLVRDAVSGKVVFEARRAGEMIRGIGCNMDGNLWIVCHAPKATTHDKPPADCYFSRLSWPFDGGEAVVLPTRLPFVRSFAVAPNGRNIAVVYGAPPTTLVVVGVERGDVVACLDVTIGGGGGPLRWSPDGTLLGSVQDGRIIFYSCETWEELGMYSVEYASSVAFSPDGDLVAVGSRASGTVLHLAEILSSKTSLK